MQPSLQSILEHFITPERNLVSISSHPQVPQPSETTNLLSVAMDLSILDVSRTWNQTTQWCFVTSLFHFAQCSQDSSLEVVACVNTKFLFVAEQYCIVWRDHVLFILICCRTCADNKTLQLKKNQDAAGSES